MATHTLSRSEPGLLLQVARSGTSEAPPSSKPEKGKGNGNGNGGGDGSGGNTSDPGKIHLRCF